MVALSQSPSPFATLLRRSKFASFDPTIAQVYTTHGGDAYRGNWGLKRPLAIRRRGACVTVKSIDTSAQQTEWNSGENQAKFMLRYGELNAEPVRFDTIQRFDSEFAPAEDVVKLPQLTQNPLKLRPKQFEKYLERLREKRPAFIEYLRERARKDPRILNKSMFELAQQPDTDYHARFLADETTQAQNTMESRAMDRSIHRNGGLIYSRPSPLQTYLTTKPLPGRILMDAIRYNSRQREAYVVGFAGMTPIFWKRYLGNAKSMKDEAKKMKWNGVADSNNGVAYFRMLPPRLRALPCVVGKRQGLKAMKLRTEVRNVIPGNEIGRSNTHMPGSVSYVAGAAAPAGRKGGKRSVAMITSAVADHFRKVDKGSKRNRTDIIGNLQRIINHP